MTCADEDLAWRIENHRSAATSLLTQVRDSVDIYIGGRLAGRLRYLRV